MTARTSALPDGALGARGLISSASWMGATSIAAQALAYAALLVLARLIPPDSFGTVAAGTAFVWMAIVVLDSGTRASVIVRPRLTRSALRRAFWRCLLVGLGLAALMAATAPELVRATAEGGEAAVIAILAISLPLYATAIIPMAVLERTMHFGKLARLTAAANAGGALAAVGIGLAGAGVWALVSRQLLWFGALAIFATRVARPHLRHSTAAEDDAVPTSASGVGDRWFFVFGATLLVAMNMDYLVVGGVSGVTQLGLYSLAFVIAFAPLQQFSGEVGRVLFAAAAASNSMESGSRTDHAVRLMAALLFPLVPVGVVLAPPILPAILGPEWKGMVAPFQVLLPVGIGWAVVNCVGETLSGVGEIAFRAKLNIAWCAATLVALLALVPLDGIRGAALAHLVVFVPYAAIYATAGARRAGTRPRNLWAALRPTVVTVTVQALVTAAVALSLRPAGQALAAELGAGAGLLVAAVISGLDRDGPVREMLALLGGLRS